MALIAAVVTRVRVPGYPVTFACSLCPAFSCYIPPPPPEDTTPYVLLGQRSQTQDTLIPTQNTQLSDTAKRHLFLSQLSMTQGLVGGTEFDELEQTLRQQYPTQTEEAHISKKQSTKEKKPQVKHKQSLPKALTKGRASGARGYTEDERINFLEILERRLPTSGSEWSLVANEHSETYPGLDRNVDSIKRQYQSLLCRREPTGDPNCPLDVKKAKAIDRLLKAKQRAGDISEENGGPIAALAGMEIQQNNIGSTEDIARNDAASVGTNMTGAALVQKRSSPKSSVSSSLIETMISFQMMQSQKEEKRREEENQKEELRREEEKRKEEDRRQREELDRKEQRRRDERREELFMSIMTAGLAAFSGNGVNPGRLMRGNQARDRDDSDDSNEKPASKRSRNTEDYGKPKEDDHYNDDDN